MAERESNDRQGDSEADLERALDRGPRPDLLGDIEENRNLSGSTTYETLPEFNDETSGGEGRARPGQT